VRLGGALAALLALTAAWPGSAAAAVSAARISALVRHSGIAGSTSVSVYRSDGSVVYRRASGVERIPASNEKVWTMVTAFQVLGPGYRFTTRARTAGGAIYLVGAGDPTLSSARLRTLALRVRQAGVTQVSQVIGDGSRFDAVRGVAGWKRGFSPDECAPLSALAIDRDWSHSKPVWHPEKLAASRFRVYLRRAGVRVTGTAVTGTTPSGAKTVARVQSHTLTTILRAAGKDSDNFTAEMVLKAVAAASGKAGTTANGIGVVRSVLAGRGLDLSQTQTADGSGLSSQDRVTTNFMVALFRSALNDPAFGGAFAGTLTVAGVDGTLKRRMTTPPARGVVRGKTGTLDVSSALTAELPGYVFSVITNGVHVNETKAHALQDKLGQLLAAG
jgi:D-alanyl-D-alanine carboxypeptidase/D-alanyl-D-alanine-endopeptidase (penicillin-binding protein 4)